MPPFTQIPKIDIEITLNPQTYSFSQQSPPTLILTITSKASTPITLFTWNTPLTLPGALSTRGITITDTATNQRVQTSKIMVQRAPLKRTKGTSDEQYFLTLEPNVPLVLSTGFGRAGGGVKPQPKSVVEKGWEVDGEGRPLKLRRSVSATGVDGLEAGHEYRVGLDEEGLQRVWWAPVGREEVLVDGNGVGSYVQDYDWENRSLDWEVSEAALVVEE